MIRKIAFWSLVALTGFNALSAIAGGIAVLVTNGLGMPTSMLASGPFVSFTWPGVILAVVVGGSQVLAGGLLIARREASCCGLRSPDSSCSSGSSWRPS